VAASITCGSIGSSSSSRSTTIDEGGCLDWSLLGMASPWSLLQLLVLVVVVVVVAGMTLVLPVLYVFVGAPFRVGTLTSEAIVGRLTAPANLLQRPETGSSAQDLSTLPMRV